MASTDSIECGEEALKHFGFKSTYRNLNHGSFGTFPRHIRSVLHSFQDECEGEPDKFIRYAYPRKLDESRETIAEYLHAPVEACVYVSNATTGVNTVLRNLVYQPGDVIIYFATIYGACHKTVDYLEETTPVTSAKVEYTYPLSDADLLSRFKETIGNIRASGKNPKLAMFDTIVSMPGVRVPFEALTKTCREEGVLSLIDGAHSVGQIPMNLSKLDPDFYVSNAHKWLHVPRGCAVFYVPVRNHHLMRSTLPTSHGFVPKTGGAISPLPPSAKSEFVNNFEFVGTIDNSPYLCVPAALEWRSRLTWQGKKGEDAIMQYSWQLARRAGEIVSKALDTEIMENAEGTLGKDVNFANVALPIDFEKDASGDMPIATEIAQWLSKVLVEEYDTFLAILVHGGKFWTRLSAQIYLTEKDFEWAGKTLKDVCVRARSGEWKAARQSKL
ncbi:Hercynylcysteine sulfoxide lyase [Pseudocercospora fuligena]|uniref:Hercynylcysteine sulfoxide lyase n=1 Tax=Pseudocercospora fuligena TaxID=685502 RepID=A0A8H6R8S3_9PEZI|nr:Hercynylcysteine sulfoxide lyase [Pseudocercospora fuligena]